MSSHHLTGGTMISPEDPNPGKLSEKLKELDLNDAPGDPDIEHFAERLGIAKYTKNENDLKKFYDFVGPNFSWPSIVDRRMIFDYITDPEWQDIGEEAATNDLAYRRLLESGELDPTKGSYVLIVHGKVVRYGEAISADEYEQLEEEFPGKYYGCTVPKPLTALAVSARDDVNSKQWQEHK